MNDSTRLGESDTPEITDSTDSVDNNLFPQNQEQEQEQQQVKKSPRALAMEALVEKRQAEQQEEADYLRSTHPRKHLDEPVYRNDDGDYIVRMKVNGAETELPLSQVQANWQKTLAADERLRQAAEQQSRLAEREYQINEREKQQQQQVSDEPDPDALEQAHTIINELYDGDPDNAANVLAKAMSSTGNSVSPDLMRATVENVMEQKRQEDILHTAVEQFREDYPDLVSDPVLFNLADQKTIEIKQLHPDWTAQQVLNESGRAIREWKTGSASGPVDNSRQARKQSLQPMPTRQSSSVYVPPNKPEPSNSPADVIAAMRRQRGQS